MTNWSKRTKAIHTGTRRSQYGEVSEAMFMTQGFVYKSAEDAEQRFIQSGPDEFIYARYGNPTVRMFEDRMAALLGYEDCFACTSGMAAVSGALTALLKASDHVVSSRALFGSCLYVLEDILSRFGVEITLVDGTDNAAWDAAIRPDTKLVFFESISNPTLEVVDMRHIVKAAHAVGALVLADDAMATPVYSYAQDCGVDLALENFDTQRAGRFIAEYVDDLSNWYVRRSRRRFWDGDHAALSTLHHCLKVVTQVMAPFTPFITERVWQDLYVTPETPSVHISA